MLRITKNHRRLILEYQGEYPGSAWVYHDLVRDGCVSVSSQAFKFKTSDLIGQLPDADAEDLEDHCFRFKLGSRKGNYFKIKGRKLGIDCDVFISVDGIAIERKTFVAERNISIFRRICEISESSDIWIGGDNENAIPIEHFEELLKRFPNTNELNKYARARVAKIVGEYIEQNRDARLNYERYLNRKDGKPIDPVNQKELIDSEIIKYEYIRDTIKEWLTKSEAYSEKQWQSMILNFLLLIFPKYVSVLENIQIKDYYSNSDSTKNRYIDIALVDANGHLDVIEVKKPFDDSLLMKRPYRDNYVPKKELSGSIMQAEKYLFHLSKWGVKGERLLNKVYGSQLPQGINVRITNPKSMIIIGRDFSNSTDDNAKYNTKFFDLEIIKRKYGNVIDIITYDDILRRLERTINSLKKRR